MKFELKNRELKIFRKVLMEHSFNKDGYEYHFLSIEPDEKGWAYNIIVNVVLPIKGQSYAIPVFSGHIHDILSNIWKYVGSSFSYSEKILVDGKEHVNEGIFISTEKQREVLSTMRNKFKNIVLSTELGFVSFDVYWKPFENSFYLLNDVYISFRFNLELSKFKLNNNNVALNLDMAENISATILDLIYDNDYLKETIDEVIYDVMNSEINITGIDDLYYQAQLDISKIDGFEVKTPSYSDFFGFAPEMFI